MSENVGSHLIKRAILDPDLEALVDIGAGVRSPSPSSMNGPTGRQMLWRSWAY